MTREEALKVLDTIPTIGEQVDALEMAIKALEQNPCEDCISRTELLSKIDAERKYLLNLKMDGAEHIIVHHARRIIEEMTSVTPQPITLEKAIDYLHEIGWMQEHDKEMAQLRWIPVSEMLPEDLKPVNITWVNHEPEPYYHDIKDKNFVATGIHYRGQWYWYSTTCADYLGEYGSNEIDEVDSAIEIIAWMPLPEVYRGGDTDAK